MSYVSLRLKLKWLRKRVNERTFSTPKMRQRIDSQVVTFHESVRHYCNEENQSRCFVRLFKKYLSHCPPDTKRNSLYLQPQKKTTQQVWYSREPLGHNKLTKIVPEMCTAAGIQGFRTNHSLRASSATRLYAARMDEQLIMECTGHRSTGGVRSYKRTTDAQPTVAEKGHQLLLPFGDSAMEPCNGSATQWKCAMEARN